MTNCIFTENGIIIRSSIAVSPEIEAIISNPEYKERILNAEKELNINHRIETKDNVHFSIAERDGGNRVAPEDCSNVAICHSEMIRLLSTMCNEEKAKQVSLENQQPEHEPTDEELFAALFDYLRDTFGVIIVGFVK